MCLNKHFDFHEIRNQNLYIFNKTHELNFKHCMSIKYCREINFLLVNFGIIKKKIKIFRGTKKEESEEFCVIDFFKYEKS